MSSRNRAVVRILVAVAVIGVVVWWLRSRGDGKSSPNGAAAAGGSGGGERVVAVQVAKVEVRDLPIWLEGLGSVAAAQQVTVRPQVDGRLDKVLFTEGQPVKKGDVLAEIDPRPWLVQLHQAQGALARDRAQLDAARRNHERYKGLHEQNLVAKQQVDDFAAQVGQFEGAIKIDAAQIESAQLFLDYATVKAPIDGVTGVRQVDAGNLVRASDPNGLVVITAIDPAAIFFTVPQDRLPGIAAAMARATETSSPVEVEVWNRDDTQKLATGTLAVLDNQVNQTTATLRLKAMAPNPTRALWPNAFVKARMLLETRRGALVIPAVAVQRGPQGTFVYVVGADKTAVLRPVTVGLLTGDRAAIDKGVEAGELVVVEGQNQIRPGGRVEAIDPSARKKGDGGAKKSTAGSGSAAP
ncbi:MAG: efflux RND transporter periplasmic adaptor subunit [Deltaproteobacteria bacterium]|nr:efflux RND transporter periplasmic adaptor subunit [Deltaproteobacteria bacterium]